MFSATPSRTALPRLFPRDPFGVSSQTRSDAKNRDAYAKRVRSRARLSRRRHSGLRGTGVSGDDACVPSDESAFAASEPAIFVSGVSLRDDALRACAALRVECFYRYDHEFDGRTDGALLFGEAFAEAKRVWLKRKLRSETHRLRRLTDLGMRVSTFAATRAAPDAATLARERDALAAAEAAEAARWDLDVPLERREASSNESDESNESAGAAPARCLIAREGARGGRETEVIGTVDLHVGARLPGEFLEGALPRRADGGEVDGEVPVVRAVGTSGPTSPAETSAFPETSPPGGEAVDVAVAAAATFADAAAADDAVVAANAALVFGELPLSAPADGGEGYAGGGALDGRRAYAFNVCVAPHARRRGVARRLLAAAHASAARGGVEHVYCHVERANAAARGLYESLGYVAEAEESDWLAGKLGRPPRVLMRKSLERDAPPPDET